MCEAGNMGDEYRKRIGNFLSNYIDITSDGYGYDNEDVIRQGIKALINEDIFSAEELQRAALIRDCVWIPLDFINKCVCE